MLNNSGTKMNPCATPKRTSFDELCATVRLNNYILTLERCC